MPSKTFLLVCEGETDIYIFQALAVYFSTSDTTLEIKSLSPHQDATSGTYPAHGFGGVLNWCTANKSRLSLLIDFQGASALILQMDTDIAKQVNHDCILENHAARKCCEERINQELNVEQEPSNCYYILPTQNTETWLLAAQKFTALNEQLKPIVNFELITDTEDRLGKDHGYSNKKRTKNSRKLNKTPADRYKKYGGYLTEKENLERARQRCAELNRLCGILEQHLKN